MLQQNVHHLLQQSWVKNLELCTAFHGLSGLYQTAPRAHELVEGGHVNVGGSFGESSGTN